jgi:hypothetical protein
VPRTAGWTTEDSSGTPLPLSKHLAATYLAVVALVVDRHPRRTGARPRDRTPSWTTSNPWIVAPMAVAIVCAVGVVRLVDRRLHAERPGPATAFRVVGLAYAWVIPAAWRRLRA